MTISSFDLAALSSKQNKKFLENKKRTITNSTIFNLVSLAYCLYTLIDIGSSGQQTLESVHNYLNSHIQNKLFSDTKLDICLIGKKLDVELNNDCQQHVFEIIDKGIDEWRELNPGIEVDKFPEDDNTGVWVDYHLLGYHARFYTPHNTLWGGAISANGATPYIVTVMSIVSSVWLLSNILAYRHVSSTLNSIKSEKNYSLFHLKQSQLTLISNDHDSIPFDDHSPIKRFGLPSINEYTILNQKPLLLKANLDEKDLPEKDNLSQVKPELKKTRKIKRRANKDPIKNKPKQRSVLEPETSHIAAIKDFLAYPEANELRYYFTQNNAHYLVACNKQDVETLYDIKKVKKLLTQKGFCSSQSGSEGLKVLKRNPYIVYLKSLGNTGNIRRLSGPVYKDNVHKNLFYISLSENGGKELERLLHRNF